MPEPIESLQPWFELIREFPREWKTYTRTLLVVGITGDADAVALEGLLDDIAGSAGEDVSLDDALQLSGDHARDPEDTIIEGDTGGQLGTDEAGVASGADEGMQDHAAADFSCDICGRKFRKAGLGSHKRAIHAVFSDLSVRVADASCPSCGQSYETRAIAIQHLRECRTCKEWVLANVVPLDHEAVVEIEAREKIVDKDRKRLGLGRIQRVESGQRTGPKAVVQGRPAAKQLSGLLPTDFEDDLPLSVALGL
eukprot:6469266-Amphidinium_carterae.1